MLGDFKRYYTSFFRRAISDAWKALGFKAWDLNAMLLRLTLFMITCCLAYYFGNFELASKKSDWAILVFLAAMMAFVPTLIWHLILTPVVMDKEKSNIIDELQACVAAKAKSMEVYDSMDALVAEGEELNRQPDDALLKLRNQMDDWSERVIMLLRINVILDGLSEFRYVGDDKVSHPRPAHTRRLNVLKIILANYAKALNAPN